MINDWLLISTSTSGNFYVNLPPIQESGLEAVVWTKSEYFLPREDGIDAVLAITSLKKDSNQSAALRAISLSRGVTRFDDVVLVPIYEDIPEGSNMGHLLNFLRERDEQNASI